MYYSYVMGIGNEIEELKDRGFTIEQFGQNYGVSFSKKRQTNGNILLSNIWKLAIGMSIWQRVE